MTMQLEESRESLLNCLDKALAYARGGETMHRSMKAAKRIIAFILVALIAVSLAPSSAFAANEEWLCGTAPYGATPKVPTVHQPVGYYKGKYYNDGKSGNEIAFATLYKKAEWVNDSSLGSNVFDITLQAFGDKIVPPPRPVYTVIVTDLSNSMVDGYIEVDKSYERQSGWGLGYRDNSQVGYTTSGTRAKYSYTRLQQVQDAAYGYIQEMFDTTTDPEGSNKIALASYAKEGRIDSGFEGLSSKAALEQKLYDYFKPYPNASSNNWSTNPIPGNSGSTNHQGGFIAAWQLIKEAMDADAKLPEADRLDPYYVVLYMSDGATTEEYTSSTDTRDSMVGFNLKSSTQGTGTTTTKAVNAASAIKNGTNPDNGVLIATVSVGIGDICIMSGSADPATLRKFATDGYDFEAEASSESVAKIYEMIKDATDNPSIESGAKITDIVPKGFEVISAKAYGLDGKEYTGAEIDIAVDKNSGETTVTWKNLPSVGANSHVSLVVRIMATDELIEEACTGRDGNHITFATNKKATLEYTNITEDKNKPWDIPEFPIPEVHIAKPRDGFYVTVNYIGLQNGKEVKIKDSALSNPLKNGDSYGQFANNSFLEKIDNAAFDHADINFGNGNVVTVNSKSDYEDAVKNEKINGYDITIKLFYQIKMSDVTVPLSKTVSLGNNLMEYPATYSFEFELHNANNKLVAKVGFNQAEIKDGSPKRFEWASNVNYYDDIEGQVLTISEKAAAGWQTIAPKPYAKIENGFVEIIGGLSTVNNVRNQAKWANPVDIILDKSFAGDLSSLVLQGDDGSVLDCINAEHRGHAHNMSCYELDCDDEDDEHEHDVDCYELVCDIAPGESAALHGPECYVYTFGFELSGQNNAIIDTKTLRLRKSDLEDLTVSRNLFEEVVFVVKAADIEKGPFKITETDSPIGWTSPVITGITINPYTGKVYYPDKADSAEMINSFGGTSYPVFQISKEVFDLRAGGGSIAANYNGTLKFGLLDSSKNPYNDKVYEIKIEKGVGTATIRLPELINRDATLYLREIKDNQDGMEYDNNDYLISIVDGNVTNTAPIVAKNDYMEPIIPLFKIIVNTNSVDNNGEFTFEYSFESSGVGVRNSGTDTVKIATSNGSGTVTIPDVLPKNFTGVLTVKALSAVQPLDESKWVLDDTIYMLEFENGVYVGGDAGEIATATFLHNLQRPNIVFTKDASSTSVETDKPVTYTLTVINTGSEDLKQVKITDTMFNANTAFTIYSGSSASPLTASQYSYESNALKFNILPKGGRLVIHYTVLFKNEGIATNKADFEGTGVNSNLELKRTSSKTVNVNDGTGGKKPLEVTKQVAIGRGGSINHNRFVDAIEINTRGSQAVFKMTVTNNTNKVLRIEEAKDLFAGKPVTQFTTVDGRPFNPIGYELAPKSSVTFYYVTAELNTRGTYVNTLAVRTRVIETGNSPVNYDDSDSATVVVRRIRGGGGHGGNGGGNGPGCNCGKDCKCKGKCKCTDKHCDGFCKGKCNGNCHGRINTGNRRPTRHPSLNRDKDKYAPNTGDVSNIALSFTALALSAAGGMLVLAKSKRKNKQAK